MKTTYKQLFRFRGYANQYLSSVEKESKFAEILEDVILDTNEIAEQWQKLLVKINRKFALKDEKTKALLKDEKGDYKFTEDGENNRDLEAEEMLNEEVYVKIIKPLPEDVPENLHRVYVKEFKDFIL